MKIFKQKTGKSCGVACLRSIFNYYGNTLSEEDIWKKNEFYSTSQGGILNPILSLGITALKFGFNVEYIGYNPIILNKDNKKTLEKSLKDKSKNYFDFGKYYVDIALKFLKLGGKITIDKLNIDKIKKIIDQNKFALVEIKPAFIYNNSSLNMNHKVIIIGYNKTGFKILDPSDGKEHLWDFDSFLLAFYAAVPELLIIKK
jgi:hypothetical protein